MCSVLDDKISSVICPLQQSFQQMLRCVRI